MMRPLLPALPFLSAVAYAQPRENAARDDGMAAGGMDGLFAILWLCASIVWIYRSADLGRPGLWFRVWFAAAVLGPVTAAPLWLLAKLVGA